mmetsp:Transcript_10166/g.18510  ORF Transcript_10166/g.18510 Transcript_10166/m.18510 type:complete len:109 (-) Transcript_10166:232-558(-)
MSKTRIDDTTKLIRLPWNHVVRLSTGTDGCFKKGTECMAIPPKTTSFYAPSGVSKQPIWKLMPGSISPIVKELFLKFEVNFGGHGLIWIGSVYSIRSECMLCLYPILA